VLLDTISAPLSVCPALYLFQGVFHVWTQPPANPAKVVTTLTFLYNASHVDPIYQAVLSAVLLCPAIYAKEDIIFQTTAALCVLTPIA